MNAITYKEIFPLIKDNKMWPGTGFRSTVEFGIPKDVEIQTSSGRVDEDGNKFMKVQGITWWTNLDYPRRHRDMILFREYKGNEDKYPKYDNYDAINIDKVADIPKDYEVVMGVPITFIGKWNPEQFDILGLAKTPICLDNSKDAKRIKIYKEAIQHNKNGTESNGNKINDAATLVSLNPPESGTYYTDEDTEGYLTTTYVRVLIRNKRLNPEIYGDPASSEDKED